MTTPTRVLHVFAHLDRGGAETVAMEWLRHIDRNQVAFDFVVNDDYDQYQYEQEAVSLGSRVSRAPRYKIWNSLPYAAWWFRLLHQHPEWRVVHGHYTTSAFLYLSIARLLGRTTIAHSHSAVRPTSIPRRFKVLLDWSLRYIAQVRVGCSKSAVDWMFGSKRKTRVIKNAVDIERFKFDPEARRRIRQELGIEHNFVIGHVGSFGAPKNHKRILTVFAELLSRNPAAKLVLVGDGRLKEQILDDITSLALTDHVILTGTREDVPALLAAMDVLLFPSLYEGLPVVIIEAQATGLPCVVSDSITPEVAVTDLVRFLSLAASDTAWVSALQDTPSSISRAAASTLVSRSGYDARQVAEEIQGLYLQLAAPKLSRKRSKS